MESEELWMELHVVGTEQLEQAAVDRVERGEANVQAGGPGLLSLRHFGEK